MRILVTGAGGFAGRHLVPLLAQRRHEVTAGVHESRPEPVAGVSCVRMDVMNRDNVMQVVKDAQPDAIVHLAAQSNVRRSWANAAETLQCNTIASLHIYEAMKSACPHAKLLSVGSSEEYGGEALPDREPITERAPCVPLNPYAVSKFAAGQLLRQLARQDGMRVIHARPFNHFGPGQREGFVVADFASQIVRIESGAGEPVIKVGNLSAVRDFTDVRDVVRAYLLLLESDIESGVYNISSMVPREIRWILDRLIASAKTAIRVEVDPEKLRPVEIPVYVGSSKKLEQAVGWKPQYDIERSLQETLEWWRERTVRSLFT